MKHHKAEASYLTAARARHCPAIVDLRLPLQPKPRGRTRIDPLAGVWNDEVVPMLRAVPRLRPVVVFRELSQRHPEISPGIRRTLQRRIHLWQGLNDPEPDVTFLQGFSPQQRILTRHSVSAFLRSAHQGILKLSDLPVQAKTNVSILNIINSCKSGSLAQRNKALLALAVVCDLPLCHLAKYPVSSTASLYRWKRILVASGFERLMQNASRQKLRFKDHDVTSAIFKILHEPPELHGFPRTNWRQIDLKNALNNNGTNVSLWTIRRTIRASKYQWRKAKIVLTSKDPEYRLKVDKIKRILSELGNDEYFFSRPVHRSIHAGEKAVCAR